MRRRMCHAPRWARPPSRARPTAKSTPPGASATRRDGAWGSTAKGGYSGVSARHRHFRLRRRRRRHGRLCGSPRVQRRRPRRAGRGPERRRGRVVDHRVLRRFRRAHGFGRRRRRGREGFEQRRSPRRQPHRCRRARRGRRARRARQTTAGGTGIFGEGGSGYGGAFSGGKAQLGSCPSLASAGPPAVPSPRAMCTWTRRPTCSCAWRASPSRVRPSGSKSGPLPSPNARRIRRTGTDSTSRPFLITLIHRGSWKERSANFGCTEFWEVRL